MEDLGHMIDFEIHVDHRDNTLNRNTKTILVKISMENGTRKALVHIKIQKLHDYGSVLIVSSRSIHHHYARNNRMIKFQPKGNGYLDI